MQDSITTFIENGLIEQEQIYNATFNWQGGTYNCIANILLDEAVSKDAGFNLPQHLKLQVRLSQFSSPNFPQTNQTVNYMGYNGLLIKKIEKPLHNVFWILDVENPLTATK